jgi:hypothetical protein
MGLDPAHRTLAFSLREPLRPLWLELLTFIPETTKFSEDLRFVPQQVFSQALIKITAL